MITERTLTKWRKEALVSFLNDKSEYNAVDIANQVYELEQRILRLTQELLDAHLMRKVSR